MDREITLTRTVQVHLSDWIQDAALPAAIRQAALRLCAGMPLGRPHAIAKGKVLHDFHVVRGASGTNYLFQWAAVPDGTPHGWAMNRDRADQYPQPQFPWKERGFAAVLFAMEDDRRCSCPISHERAAIMWAPYKNHQVPYMTFEHVVNREWAKTFVADYDSIAAGLKAEAELEDATERAEIQMENDARQDEKRMIAALGYVPPPKKQEPKPKQRKRKSR